MRPTDIARALLIPALAASLLSGATPNNNFPGVVVTWPVADSGQDHLRLAASFVVTGNLESGFLVATATLPTGERQQLRAFSVQPCSIHYTFTLPGQAGTGLADSSCGPESFPLTGPAMAVNSLPLGAIIEVQIAPAHKNNEVVIIKTTTSMRGLEQSADRQRLRIAGDFSPTLPAYVYFGLWPVPVRPEALVVSGKEITVDFSKDPAARRWITDFYAITVFQPGAVCDSILARFRSPLE